MDDKLHTIQVQLMKTKYYIFNQHEFNNCDKIDTIIEFCDKKDFEYIMVSLIKNSIPSYLKFFSKNIIGYTFNGKNNETIYSFNQYALSKLIIHSEIFWDVFEIPKDIECISENSEPDTISIPFLYLTPEEEMYYKLLA